MEPDSLPAPKKELQSSPKESTRIHGDPPLQPVSLQKQEQPQLVEPEKQPKVQTDPTKAPVTTLRFALPLAGSRKALREFHRMPRRCVTGK